MKLIHSNGICILCHMPVCWWGDIFEKIEVVSEFQTKQGVVQRR